MPIALLILAAALGSSGNTTSPNHSAKPYQRIPIDPPGDREFIVDKAEIITTADKKIIRQLADQLLTDTKIPVIVVTVSAIDDYQGSGMRLQTFAQILFDQWQIGFYREGASDNHNYGILLLVTVQERRARIELGRQWNHAQDDACKTVMQEQIIPRFKAGDYSGGIVDGVRGLEKIARGLDADRPAVLSFDWFTAAVFLLGALSAVSFYRSGTEGWANQFWGVIFAIIPSFLEALTAAFRAAGEWEPRFDGDPPARRFAGSGRRKGGASRGYRGGSFGGGFSGGGGASGSW